VQQQQQQQQQQQGSAPQCLTARLVFFINVWSECAASVDQSCTRTHASYSTSGVICTAYAQEEAVEFARKYGWEYTVEDPQQRNPIRQKRFAGYGENFR
jgi:hypothetical protein